MDKYGAYNISSDMAKRQGMSTGQQWALQAMMTDHDKKRGEKRRTSKPKPDKRKFFWI